MEKTESGTGRGLIFDIDRYAIHDGPGIRFLIFMKGCPLWCLWCSNPESQNTFREVSFFSGKCIGCGSCIGSCPQNAIRTEGEKLITDWESCTNCGQCTVECFAGARKLFGRLVDIEELLEEVKKDIVFLRNSGGGVTIGGGEATAQPEFVTEFLKMCKAEALHTAIETCGFCSWNNLRRILQYTDLVYYDIKHMNPERHKRLTGFSNRIILENLIKLSQTAVDLIVRLPVIPLHNDDEENIRSVAEFVVNKMGLSRVKRIELLPYHKLGMFKYERLGRTYELNDVEVPSEAQVLMIKEILGSHGLAVQIGG